MKSFIEFENAIENVEKAIRKAKRSKKPTKEIQKELEETSRKLYLETIRRFKYSGFHSIGSVREYKKVLLTLEKAAEISEKKTIKTKNKSRIKGILKYLRRNREIYDSLSEKIKKL